MRAVIQRVSSAAVRADGLTVGAIGHGLLVYVGIDRDDAEADVAYLVDKVRYLRVFADDESKLNRDVCQAGGEVLVISAFTVQADARRGRRPSFDAAAAPERAFVLYEMVCDGLAREGLTVARGSFGADMKVESVNDGPICLLLESRRNF